MVTSNLMQELILCWINMPTWHLLSNHYVHFVLLQEIELTEKAQKEDQEFEELVAFIQQRLTQTEVTFFWSY